MIHCTHSYINHVGTLKAIYPAKLEAKEYCTYGLNLYGGCSHDCLYCYNKARFTDPNWRNKKSSLEAIEHDLKNWQGPRELVNLTFVGDAYDLGRDDMTSRDVLQLFRKYDHHFQMLTKGGLKACIIFSHDTRHEVYLIWHHQAFLC